MESSRSKVKRFSRTYMLGNSSMDQHHQAYSEIICVEIGCASTCGTWNLYPKGKMSGEDRDGMRLYAVAVTQRLQRI